MNLAQVGQLLLNLTTRFNQFIANAKKIDDLPEAAEADPSGMLHVSVDGVSQKLEIAKLLANNIDHIFNFTGFEIDEDENFILNPGNGWKINGATFTNTEEISAPIAFSTTGMKRSVVVVLNQANSFEFVNGEEDPLFASKPVIPASTLELTDFIVTDNEVLEPTHPPVVGNPYLTKASFRYITISIAGVINNFPAVKASRYRFTAATEIHGLITPSSTLYDGQPMWIYNDSAAVLTLKHLSGLGVVKFWFPELADFVLPAGHNAEFSIDLENGRLIFVGCSILGGSSIENPPIQYLQLKKKANGVSNINSPLQINDIVEGWADATTYWTTAIYNGGDATDRNNYTPLVETNEITINT